MKQEAKDRRKDVTRFASDVYILPETGKAIELRPHQEIILKACLTRNADGRFPYQTIVYSCLKKSGKTEVGSLVALWFAFSECPYNEVYFIANDLEQAQSRGYKRVCAVIEAAKHKGKRIGLLQAQRSAVKFPDGTEIRALSSDYAGESGANPGLTVWDELWAYRTESARRLYSELCPVPTRKNSLRFIVTYAGFEGESKLLWDIYQLGLAGHRMWTDEEIDEKFPDLEELEKDALRHVWVNEKAGLFMYWDNQSRMPWQTLEYYERERRTTRPSDFLRLHKNQWVSAESSFMPPEVWDSCVHSEYLPVMPGFRQPLFVGVDIGTKRDSTGVAAVFWDKEHQKMKLAMHRIWQPSRLEPLDFEKTIENYLIEMKDRFNVAIVYYDPSQFVRSSQLLAGQGVSLFEYNQVPSNLSNMTKTLWELCRTRNLEMYPSPELREQALNCVIIEGTLGMRIAKEKAKQKIDCIVALAMACQAAWDGAGLTSLPESQPEEPSKWQFRPMTSPEVVEGGEITSRSKWRI